jgi:hypothetical protein
MRRAVIRRVRPAQIAKRRRRQVRRRHARRFFVTEDRCPRGTNRITTEFVILKLDAAIPGKCHIHSFLIHFSYIGSLFSCPLELCQAGGSAQKAFDYVCANFKGSLSFLAGICDALTGILALPIQLALDAGEIPDVTCKTGALAFLKLCKAEDAQCQLFSGPVKQRAHHFGASASVASSSSPLEERAELNAKVRAHIGAFAALLGGRGLAGGLRSTATAQSQSKAGPHRPTLDLDNDAFSTVPTLRGTHWRGKDCDDLDASVYPGRALNLVGPAVDHNCNGISGVNSAQQSYEDAFCSGPNAPRGTIVLGM